MEEHHLSAPDAPDTSDAPNVSDASDTPVGATLAPAPDNMPGHTPGDTPGDTPGSAPADQGALRPIWPVSERGKGARLARRYALLARLAATACALLFFYVSWAPLANALTSGDLRIAPTGPMYRFSLTAAELGAAPLHQMFGDSFFGLWSAITVAGLLLSPLLWQSASRWVRLGAITLYACWFIIITGILMSTAQIILVTLPDYLRRGAGPYLTTLYPYGTRVAIFHVDPAFGLWLALLAALLGIAAAGLALRAILLRRRATVPVLPSVQAEIVTPGDTGAARSLPGAGAITGGLVLWAWGFFLLPWATLNCAQAPLLVGVCRGLPVTSALQIGLNSARAAFDPSAALYAITGMLLVGALAILVSVWLRAITRTLCAWASLWLAFALGCAVLAIVGAQQVVRDAPSVGLPTGDWRGDTGVLIVFLALLLVAIGLIPLWAVAVRATRRRAAADRAQGF